MKIDKRMLAVRHAAASYHGRYALAAVRLEKGRALATDGRLAAEVPQRSENVEANPHPIMIHKADADFVYREAEEDKLLLKRDVDGLVYIDQIDPDGWESIGPVHVAHECEGEYPDGDDLLSAGQSPEKGGPWTYINVELLERVLAVLREAVDCDISRTVAVRVYEFPGETKDPGVLVFMFQLADGRVGKIVASPSRITGVREYAPLHAAIKEAGRERRKGAAMKPEHTARPEANGRAGSEGGEGEGAQKEPDIPKVTDFENALDRVRQVHDAWMAEKAQDGQEYLHDIHEALAEAGHPTLACTAGPDGGNDGVTHVECVNALARERDDALQEVNHLAHRLAHPSLPRPREAQKTALDRFIQLRKLSGAGAANKYLDAIPADALEQLDLQRDEFRRIMGCPGVDDEIRGLCERAAIHILQHVPVLEQRDAAVRERDQARAERDDFKASFIETGKSLGKSERESERLREKLDVCGRAVKDAETRAFKVKKERDELKEKLAAAECLLGEVETAAVQVNADLARAREIEAELGRVKAELAAKKEHRDAVSVSLP